MRSRKRSSTRSRSAEFFRSGLLGSTAKAKAQQAAECDVCGKRLGKKAVLECDDCGMKCVLFLLLFSVPSVLDAGVGWSSLIADGDAFCLLAAFCPV